MVVRSLFFKVEIMRDLCLDIPGTSTERQFKDLIVREALKGKAAKGDHLVEEYAVAPDVRHWGEQTICEALWRHPAYREHPWENTNRRDPQNICKYLEKCFYILFVSRDANMRIRRLIRAVVFFLDLIICTLVLFLIFSFPNLGWTTIFSCMVWDAEMFNATLFHTVFSTFMKFSFWWEQILGESGLIIAFFKWCMGNIWPVHPWQYMLIGRVDGRHSYVRIRLLDDTSVSSLSSSSSSLSTSSPSSSLSSDT